MPGLPPDRSRSSCGQPRLSTLLLPHFVCVPPQCLPCLLGPPCTVRAVDELLCPVNSANDHHQKCVSKKSGTHGQELSARLGRRSKARKKGSQGRYSDESGLRCWLSGQHGHICRDWQFDVYGPGEEEDVYGWTRGQGQCNEGSWSPEPVSPVGHQQNLNQ